MAEAKGLGEKKVDIKKKSAMEKRHKHYLKFDPAFVQDYNESKQTLQEIYDDNDKSTSSTFCEPTQDSSNIIESIDDSSTSTDAGQQAEDCSSSDDADGDGEDDLEILVDDETSSKIYSPRALNTLSSLRNNMTLESYEKRIRNNAFQGLHRRLKKILSEDDDDKETTTNEHLVPITEVPVAEDFEEFDSEVF